MTKTAASSQSSLDLRVGYSMRWRYLLALSLMAILSTAAWWSLRLVISEQNSIAAVVNVSGRQRMLSQRTALFAVLLQNAPVKERPAIRDQLKETIELMERSHLGLIHGDSRLALPDTMSSGVRALYMEGADPVDAQVTAYIQTARELLLIEDGALRPDNPQLQYLVGNASSRLIQALDQIVSQYQLEGEATVARLQKGETTLWVLSLLLLVFEALLIFKPFVKHLEQVVGALRAVTVDLRQHQDDLEDLIEQRTQELQGANTELLRKEEQVRKLAFHDALTGLPNRRLFKDRLSQAMAAGQRDERYGALMFLDLDNFKPLNDAQGHGVGDLLLIEVARRLEVCLNEIDTVARFGGDEFVVLLSKLSSDRADSIEQALGVAEKIRATLAAPYHLCIPHPGKGVTTLEHHCSASIGVALFRGQEFNQADILKWADVAMYQAKKAGRNTIRFHG